MFRPRFWEDADGRCAAVKEIKRRLDRLREDAGADSYQKEMLCERAVFMALRLETMETEATEGRAFEAGSYGQAVNTFLGLLKALGLERKVKAVGLKAYIRSGG